MSETIFQKLHFDFNWDDEECGALRADSSLGAYRAFMDSNSAWVVTNERFEWRHDTYATSDEGRDAAIRAAQTHFEGVIGSGLVIEAQTSVEWPSKS